MKNIKYLDCYTVSPNENGKPQNLLFHFLSIPVYIGNETIDNHYNRMVEILREQGFNAKKYRSKWYGGGITIPLHEMNNFKKWYSDKFDNKLIITI